VTCGRLLDGWLWRMDRLTTLRTAGTGCAADVATLSAFKRKHLIQQEAEREGESEGRKSTSAKSATKRRKGNTIFRFSLSDLYKFDALIDCTSNHLDTRLSALLGWRR